MMTLVPLDDSYSIYKFPDEREIPSEIKSSGFYSLTRTKEEISVVTNCQTDFGNVGSGRKWKGFKVDGVLDFSLVGIIHCLTKPLKDNGIPVFIISTFNTDYLFVSEEDFGKTMDIYRVTDTIAIRGKETKGS
jgi:uncharacterized protein